MHDARLGSGDATATGRPPHADPPPTAGAADPWAGAPTDAFTSAGLAALVRWAASAPLREPWDRARLREGYCTRSPRRVLAEGRIAFSAPCADLSAVAAVGLERAGLRPTLVLAGIARPLQPVKFQTGLEVELEGNTWVVGFGVSSTYLYRGTFVETQRRPWVHRRRPERVDPDASFLAHFEAAGREALPGLFPGYDLERDLRSHGRQNARWRFLLARRKARRAARAERAGRLTGGGGRWA